MLLNSPIMSFNNSYYNPCIIGLPHWVASSHLLFLVF